jgi:predicted site-specific integrase-resolvase
VKLTDDARQQGVSSRPAWRWWKAGKLPGQQMDTGTILIEPAATPPSGAPQRVAISARVSLAENTSHLDSQAERPAGYCAARGYQVAKAVKEVGSGINDARPQLLALLEDQGVDLIVVEHTDRLTRFGFRYLDTLLQVQGHAIEVVNQAANQAENGTEDLLADLTAIVDSFCARLYGQRRTRRKTEVIVRALEAKREGEPDATG